MEQSASRWDYVTEKSQLRLQVGTRWNECLGAINDTAKVILDKTPAPVQALLRLQYLTSEHSLVICVCDNIRTAQKCFYESVRGRLTAQMQPILIHEQMPVYQQDYLFDCLNVIRDAMIPDTVGLFTTRGFYNEIAVRAPWLLDSAVVLTTDGNEISVSPNYERKLNIPTVSCICLRQSSSGQWVLMDHDVAATICPDRAPEDKLVTRLLSHSINISGHRLAPYLAQRFDVPDAWKVKPELVRHCLLVFKKNMCHLKGSEPGIPLRLIWSDILGIVQ